MESFLGHPLLAGLPEVVDHPGSSAAGWNCLPPAHQGLKSAIAAVFAVASWQRCRTHFMANLLTRVPQRALLSLSKGRRHRHGSHHLPAAVQGN